MSDHGTSANASVAVAATFTVDPLLPALRFVLNVVGLKTEVRPAPYHQVFQEFLSANSLLAENVGGTNVVLIRLEDFIRDVADLDLARLVIERTGRELAEALSQFERRAKSPTILTVLPRSPRAIGALAAALDAATDALTEHARDLVGIHFVTAGQIEQFCVGEFYDTVRDELAHIPFTDEFYASMALAIGRKVHALIVPPHKVLVLDCDNTIWRGVVGEDGIGGIAITPPFVALQEFAVAQQAKGILICLASKNTERDVLDVFDRRSDMTLKLEHVIAHRINWESKPDNVASLARELNLGVDSFVFLDDNPIECAQMRAALPQVVTLQLPPDEAVEAFLANLWVFDKTSVTSEDLRRTDLYRENAARQLFEESETDIGDFIASLGLVIKIEDPKEGQWPRMAQLTQRTNQFNFTTHRWTEAELRACQANGCFVLGVNVADRFGDYGLVGEIVANAVDTRLVVDTLLLSCRVLGRGVEHAMIRRLGEIAAELGLGEIDLEYVVTAKNEPARAFAESIAAIYRLEEEKRIVYRIPADVALKVEHRPGHDPEAVIKARKSDERKTSGAVAPAGPSMANRSEGYARIALDFHCGGAILRALRTESMRARPLADDPEDPATETERVLLGVWKELLNIDELGVTDDYFALGGTSLLAVQLFIDVERQFSVKLPLTAIVESPTVRSLARQIQPQGVDQGGALVELKRGGSCNFFLVHDGDGETLLYRNLARRMPGVVAVLGIAPRRAPGVPLAHTRIEDMAEYYIAQLRERQPAGPYMLGGLCAGGVIAFEMAVQLKIAGEAVGLVAILDAAKPHARRRAGRITKERVRRLEQMFTAVGQGGGGFLSRLYGLACAAAGKVFSFLAWQCSSRARRLSTQVRFRLLDRLLTRGKSWPPFLKELTVREIYDSAEARYTPRQLSDAGVLLARARSGTAGDTPYREIFADAAFDWRSVAPDLRLVDVEGGHSSMLQEPYVESLAAALASSFAKEPESVVVSAKVSPPIEVLSV